MKRTLVLIYGGVCYAVFFGTFVYAIGFIGGIAVPTTLDGPPRQPWHIAALIDAGLLALFAIQHSGMARQGFKRWLSRWVPRHVERSTYVLVSSLLLILLFWLWQPLGGTLWSIQSEPARYAVIGLYLAGWVLVLVSTFLIDHFDLFGLKQTWRHFRGEEYQYPEFHTPGLYRLVRHPLYVGWLIVFWAAPTMTVGHLLFALMTTGYILVAIQFEERDLVRFHGQAYAEYRRRVPMLIPFAKRRRHSVSPTPKV